MCILVVGRLILAMDSPRPCLSLPSLSLSSCAHEDFAAFNEFYGKVLQNGILFEDNFNVKVVAFHPDFVQSPLHPSLQSARSAT